MKASFLLFPVALLLALLAGCRHTRPLYSNLAGTNLTVVPITNQLNPELLQAGNNFFTLGPGDRLELEVLGHADTRAAASVGPDGRIYYQLLPGLDVWGLTLPEARQLLERELAKYYSEPQVVVTLREVGSKQVWLLGRINKPGIYPLASPMTLLEALASAGGTARSSSPVASQELADLRHSFLLRQGQFVPVDFYRLLREGDTSQNVVLRPDDFVYVRSALAQEVYVLGAVRLPRAVPYTEQMSLMAALAATSGGVKFDWLTRYDSGIFVKDAFLSHVAIVRGSLAQPQIAVVDANAIMKGRAPDVPLEPGDIVYVPNSPFRWLKSYANLVVNTFVTTVAANEGVRAGGGNVGIGVSVPVGTGR